MTEIRRRIMWVGAASGFDAALSFLTPFVLARLVSVAGFGEYRFFWLVALTLVTVVVIGIEHALMYFLHRVPEQKKTFVVGNTLLYFHVAAIVGALMAGPWNTFIAERMTIGNHLVLALFCLIYLTSLPLDYLPLAHDQPTIHAKNVGLTAVVRVVSIIIPAYVTRDIAASFYGLLFFSIIRVVLLARFGRRQYGRILFPVDRDLLRKQVAYSIPFGLSGSFYIFRTQGEQWLVSGLYSIQAFAAFSIGVFVGPLLQVLQQPVSRVLQPKIHALAAEGQLARAHELSRRANVNVGFVTYPLIVFAAIFADVIVALLLPPEYAAAAAVMQVYLLVQFRLAMESGSLLQVLGLGNYAMRAYGVLLLAALAISTVGARYGGLAGAATGSVVAGFVEIFLIQRRLAAALGVSLATMQDWGLHARLIGMAVIANGAAYLVGNRVLAEAGPFWVLAGAGVAMVVAYLSLPRIMGLAGVAQDVLPWARAGTR